MPYASAAMPEQFFSIKKTISGLKKSIPAITVPAG